MSVYILRKQDRRNALLEAVGCETSEPEITRLMHTATVWKELERLLEQYRFRMSPAKAIELSKTIYQLSSSLPDSGKTQTAFAKLSDQQKLLLQKFHFG